MRNKPTLKAEYKVINGEVKLKRMADYTLKELQTLLLEYHKHLDRQHGRASKIKERVFEDNAKEKKRLWTNYRMIIYRDNLRRNNIN